LRFDLSKQKANTTEQLIEFLQMLFKYNNYEVRLTFASFFIDTACKEFAKEHKINTSSKTGKAY